MADIHDEAMEWAQANPSDPRSQDIQAKAWAAKNPDDPRAAAISAKLAGASAPKTRVVGKGGSVPVEPSYPEGHPENPKVANFFEDPHTLVDVGGNVDRTKQSFGDLGGMQEELQKRGFSDVKKNSAGDYIAKGADGQYYRDANHFLGNPVNWAESHTGQALPTAGMIIGGATSAPGIVTAAAGAGGGAMAGEAGRIMLGKTMGVYRGGTSDALKDVALEGAGGAAAEAGGKVIGKFPIPGTGLSIDGATKLALEKMVAGGAKASTRASQFLTGKDSEAYLRYLMNTKRLDGALVPENVMDVVARGRAEGAAKDKAMNKMISGERQAFRDDFGPTIVQTPEMIGATQEAAARNAPNAAGQSGMEPKELEELTKLQDSLQTKRVTQPEVKASNLDVKKDPLTGQKTFSPGKEFTVTPEAVSAEPQAPVSELAKTADYLQKEIDASAYKPGIGPGSNRSAKSQAALQNVLGKLKGAFHGISPAYKAADATYSKYASQAPLLDPLMKEGQGESFAANLFGANKVERQAAAKAVIPKTYEDLADIGAMKELTGADSRLAKVGGPTGAGAIRVGGTMASGAAGAAMGGPIGGLVGLVGGAATAGLTSPAAHKALYGLAGKYGMPVVEALVKNPQLAPALLDKVDLYKLRAVGANVWSSMRGEQNGQK